MSAKVRTTQEALMLLKDGLRHAQHNPNIYSYVPHAKQLSFHKSRKKGKLYIGGNRSGKTTGGVCEDVYRATCRHPYRSDLNSIGPNRGRVVAVDFIKGVEAIIFPQFKQWLYPSAMRGGAWESAYDKGLRTLHFENGSFIEFMSYDQDLDKFAGTSRHWIHFDEECPKPIWQECRARLIDTNGDWYLTMTPVEGMTWIYDDIYEPNIDNSEGSVDIIEVEMYENPHLTVEAIKEFVKDLDADELDKRLKGHFIQQGGLIYKDFDTTKGGRHILLDEIPSFEVKERYKDHLIIQSLDHGLNNPTSVHWHAVDSNGFVETFWEHYQAGWVVGQHAERIKQIEKAFGRQADLRVADPTIKNRLPNSGESIQLEYQKHGLAFTLGNNDKIAGINKVRRYLRNVPYTEPPRARWSVRPNCEKLIWEMKKYRWKTYRQKALNYENNAYEEPHDKDNHACDDLRYALMSRPDLAAEGPGERADKILSRLGIKESSTAVTGVGRIADPNERVEAGWQDYNSKPAEGGWESSDEHMGDIW